MRVLLVFLLFTFSFVASENLGSGAIINAEDIDLILVNKFNEKSSRYNLKNVVNLLKDPNFHADRVTAFFAFDFNEDQDSISTFVVSEAFSERGDYNLIILDYGKFSGGNLFFDALPNSVKVARLFANALIELNKQGLKRVHLIGYSLGAHLMGETGRTIQKLTKSSMKIAKIIGLDPAGPGFYPLNPYVVALNRNDAEFVQIIHTDSKNFGISIPTGHVDFWPNGGKEQPNCPPFDKVDILKTDNQCNHIRSVLYFAESVRHKNSSIFHAVTCDSWESFTNYKCFDHQPKLVNHMGLYADSKLFGNYYLQTNDKPDFSKDKQGVIYNNNPYVVTPFLSYVN